VSLKILQDDGQSEEVCGQPRAKAQARQDAPPLRVPSGRRRQRPFPRAFRRVGQGDQGGVYRFRTFRQEIKVIKLDKGTQDFYMRLTTFHSQFRAIGTNYNQCVRALKSNFSEKKALAFLYKLERHTLELVELSKRISALVEEFQSKYPVR
ncbi:LOW QUALITY PROTEIN: conserved hypothetical protein, partial [Bacteroides sp. D22]